MKTRTLVCLTVAFVGYGVFLHASRAIGQEPVESVVPRIPAAPILPATTALASIPGVPQMTIAMPAVPAVPGIPAVPALNLAIPPIPAIPAMPGLPALRDWRDHRNGGWSLSDRGPVESCDALDIRLHDQHPTIQPEERSVSKSEAHVLRVHTPRNSGAQVHGWDKENYGVTACKAAVGPDTQKLLSEIKLNIKDGEVSVSGPSDENNDWTVFLIIRTPKAADVEVTAENGPISFYQVDGKLRARATNGPISVASFTGEGEISAVNGPISFSGNGGKLKLHTENGPISVDVKGSNWDGGGLVADAINGPVSLHVPAEFQSSFLIEAKEHAPVSCHASICSQTRRTWDDENRRIEFGSGSPVIHLSTHNGPISVD
jgi:hypothetical protein